MPRFGHSILEVSDRIRIAIEQRIRTGELAPGDSIDEHALTSLFGVSCAPASEALPRLQTQVKLVSLCVEGVVVAKGDVRQFLALWGLLADLDRHGARYTCQRMSQDKRDELGNVAAESARRCRRLRGFQLAVSRSPVPRRVQSVPALGDPAAARQPVPWRGTRRPRR